MQDEVSHIKFFSPPLDSRGRTVKAVCLDVFKRTIFKIATALERIHLFKHKQVRARSVTLEVIHAKINDSIDL